MWKCDYCSVIGTKQELKKHESICPNNPTNKKCRTCDNCVEEYDYDTCKIHHITKSNSVVCNDWINNEIRNKKLNKIINKL